MKKLKLIFIMIGIGMPTLQQLEAQEGKEKDKIDYQVRLLAPQRVQDAKDPNHAETIQLNGLIKVGVYGTSEGTLGSDVTKALNADKPSAAKNLKLYLNGVPMDGLEPLVLSPDESAEYMKKEPKPSWILQFQLARSAQDEANRKAWDTLLPRLNFGENKLQIGIGFNGRPPHLGDGNELSFKVAAGGFIRAVILGGLILFALLMWWAISGKMLREAGENTAYSLGRTQMAFWGLLTVLTFLGVFAISHKMERIPEKVLILIGISATTGLGAVLIGDSKMSSASQEAGNLAKVVADDRTKIAGIETEKSQLEAQKATGGVAWDSEKEKRLAVLIVELTSHRAKLAVDEASLTAKTTDAAHEKETGSGIKTWFFNIISDSNGPCFHRFQVVLWTMVLGIVFVWTVTNTFSMPEFENTLLLLMGISNGTYLGFKIPEKQG